MSIHVEHPGPPHPKMISPSVGIVQAFGVEKALALRAEGASWEEVARAARTRGWFDPHHAADEAAYAVWVAAGEPGVPRWEDQPICSCGAWESGSAANDYFRACDAAFERWVAEHR